MAHTHAWLLPAPHVDALMAIDARGARPALARFLTANVLFGAGLFAHAFLYNFYLEAVGANAAVMGGAAASITAGGLVALVPAGQLVDRRGPALAFLVATVLAATGLIASAFVTRPLAVYATGFIAGLGTTTWRVVMGPSIMRLAAERTRSRVFSWNVALLVASGSVWTAASGAAPGWFESLGVDAVGGLRAALVAGALGTLLAALLVPHRALRARPGERTSPVVESSSRSRRSALPAGIVWTVAIVALWMSAAGLVLPFFNVFFQRVHALEIERIGAMFAAAQLATAAVIAASAEAAARIGPRRTLAAWTVLFPPALLALAWVGAPGPAVALYFLAGFVPPATNPLIDQVLLEGTPEARHGVISSWRNAATECSGLIGASVGGVLLQATSFAVLLSSAAAVALAGAIGLAIALRRLRPDRLRLAVPL